MTVQVHNVINRQQFSQYSLLLQTKLELISGQYSWLKSAPDCIIKIDPD